jgi:4a-hydroxytetrahydrobiopterin dehydratase
MSKLLEGIERAEALDELSAAGWTVEESGNAVTRQFKFKTFPEALGWMVHMGVIAEKMNHHPEWSNVYNRVDVRLTTHDAGGLTSLDLELARRMSQ